MGKYSSDEDRKSKKKKKRRSRLSVGQEVAALAVFTLQNPRKSPRKENQKNIPEVLQLRDGDLDLPVEVKHTADQGPEVEVAGHILGPDGLIVEVEGHTVKDQGHMKDELSLEAEVEKDIEVVGQEVGIDTEGQEDRYQDTKRRSDKTEDKSDPVSNIPGFEDMAPHEQAKIRMQFALKAAAAADEKIRQEEASSSTTETDQKPKDILSFSNAVAEIEDFGFTPSSFKSSRSTKKKEDTSEKILDSHDQAMFGISGLALKTEPGFNKPITIDPNTLAHSNLYVDSDEKMERWIAKLTSMRRKKMEGLMLGH
ncbi:hypothetical protein LOTGIDRAFT_162334 [Lottia gigantea]|uniref:Uncharacterized protein n=1 Tax=Lottia gigantea TaxID=225164 RepID=V4A825_LOTGI|nr:hypothetical protein LOTGIDRAFT_162334 [Lottia gigantea]ESO92857.1 hypothetical protein LOTGIDRAFT_162334 [Lottia gigantea]